MILVQGVLKLRKRVTLTVVIISAIFGVSWGTHSILHVLNDIGSYKLSPFAIPISHVMIMFNSAVNPFAYALINQRFRKKMKEMFCCSSVRVRPDSELKDKELVKGMSLKPNNTAHSNLRKSWAGGQIRTHYACERPIRITTSRDKQVWLEFPSRNAVMVLTVSRRNDIFTSSRTIQSVTVSCYY